MLLIGSAKNQAGWTNNSSPTSFLIEGRKVSDPQEMANIQMKTFQDKTNKLLEDLPPPTIDPCKSLRDSINNWGNKREERDLFKFKTITNMETLRIIKDLGNTTSTANDRMDALSLKHGAEILHGPITHIINCSITSSKFATKWKIGKLLPLHKGKGLRS